MKQALKRALLSSAPGRYVYGWVQEEWFERTYRRRRERYEAALAGNPEGFSQQAHLARARKKLAARGYQPQQRSLGEIHTFAYVPGNWQHQTQIASALSELGPVSRFDYAARGTPLASLRSCASGHVGRRKALLQEMLKALRTAHQERPIDWFFSYALGWDMDRSTLQLIHEEFGIPTVNISLDDKNWWDEIERGDAASALKSVAPHYDLGWASARVVLPWYWAEGGQAIFLPEGVNSSWFRPLEDVTQDVEVGFVGNAFGYRPQIVEQLRKAEIGLVVFGNGWPNGVLSDDDMLKFFNRCSINLGLGDMHFSRTMTNLKGRDFEVPSTGRGLYLTAFNSDLATCFNLGTEIAAYRGLDEMIELLRHYLRNRDEVRAMARAARARCLREHQWRHRFEAILRALGILPAGSLPSTLPQR